MPQIELTNFRCFAETGTVDVRPVTFLVGENSAGKTTFLAALRVLLESFSRSSQNPFNTDPYFLGGFDQIAHYRGGRVGRAKYFSLKITVPIRSNRAAPISSSHKFKYIKGSPQPELSGYEFRVGSSAVVLSLEEGVKLEFRKDGIPDAFSFPIEKLPRSVILKRDFNYIVFMLSDIVFGTGIKDSEFSPDGPFQKSELAALLNNMRMSIASLSRNAFASSPVRTQPLRTYTPSEIQASSEGSHVPLEMARLKISSPATYEKIHEGLQSFGEKSGLFDDIDIRLLGKRDGDPFQVVVKNNGPPFNLMDVGYGVSQALPIIYQLEQSHQHDAFLLQQPEVHLHPRAQAEIGTSIARLSRAKPLSLYVLETHSDYIIDRVRIEIARGNFDHNNATIVFFEKHGHEVVPTNIYFSEKGEIINPPPDFRSFFLEEHARLLGL